MSRPRDPDSFYVEDCRQVQSNTHAIQTLTGQISRMVGTLGADKDYLQCRQMVDDAIRQASETRTVLLRIREHQHQAQNPGEKNNRRMMYQKLSDNLAITARVLEDVVRRFTAEEKKHLVLFEEHRASSAPKAGAGLGLGLGGGDEAGGNDVPLMEDLDGHLRQEKHQALRRVDEDMRCLQRIYTDLATAADEQQHAFDSLESHMQSAACDIERGRDEISLSRYGYGQQIKRKAMIFGGSALAFVAFVWFFVPS